ncbi:hypothetical protein D3C78_1223930 [compost metagenome]
MLGPGKQDHPRRIQQGRKQQILQAAGIQQPDRVDQGDPGDQKILAPPTGMTFISLAAHRQQHRIRRRPQIRHQDHRRSQIDQAGISAGREQRDQQEQLNHDVGHPQRVGWHVVGIFLGQETRHGLIAGGGKEDLGAEQGPGQQGTEQRNRQADADQQSAPGADDMFQHRGQ